MNTPRPRWCTVRGSFTAGSIQAFTTSSTKKLYRFTSRVSTTRHSRFAQHSATSGDPTSFAGAAVSAEGRELVHAAPGAVAARHHLRRELRGRDVEHALARGLQRREAEVASADHAADQRRLEVHHRVPGHRHHVGAALVARGYKKDRAGFEQAVDLVERQGVLPHGLFTVGYTCRQAKASPRYPVLLTHRKASAARAEYADCGIGGGRLRGRVAPAPARQIGARWPHRRPIWGYSHDFYWLIRNLSITLHVIDEHWRVSA
jgi:hypothetical protein